MRKLLAAAVSLFVCLCIHAQNVGIGTTNPLTRLHVEGTAQNIATFNGGTNMWITLAESGINRGYIGSFAGNNEDVDFGTYASNNTGKVHLTTSNIPRLTILNSGNIGIGTTTPLTTLDIAGSIRIGNSGINLEGSIRYNNGKFEGYNGTGWKRFDQVPPGNIAYSFKYPDPDLEGEGFKLVTSFKGQARLFDTTGVAANTWLPTATLLADDPLPRSAHCAIWTGNKMIIWAGFEPVQNAGINSGCAYDPARNTWKDISTVNAPSPRYGPKAVWTGSEMIVWGGRDPAILNTGGKYNPATDTWTSMSTINAPLPRSGQTIIWTGTEMIVWGGSNGTSPLNDGAKYNPVTNTWTSVSVTGAPAARYLHSAVWTGSEMIIWGGKDNSDGLDNGAKYNPVANTWSPISSINAGGKRSEHTAVWTGTEMIIWGGRNGAPIFNSGCRYNVVTDTWSGTTLSGAPAPLTFHHTAWTGSKMIVWGNSAITATGGFGGLYDPSGDSWTIIPLLTQPVLTGISAVAIWTGNEFIVQGGASYVSPSSNPETRGGWRYFPNALPSLQTAVEKIGYLYVYQKQ